MEGFRPIKETEFRESEAVSVGAHTAGILLLGDWFVRDWNPERGTSRLKSEISHLEKHLETPVMQGSHKK